MVLLAATAREISLCKQEIDAAAVIAETGVSISYLVGTMVELPFVHLCRGAIEEAEFFHSALMI